MLLLVEPVLTVWLCLPHHRIATSNVSWVAESDFVLFETNRSLILQRRVGDLNDEIRGLRAQIKSTAEAYEMDKDLLRKAGREQLEDALKTAKATEDHLQQELDRARRAQVRAPPRAELSQRERQPDYFAVHGFILARLSHSYTHTHVHTHTQTHTDTPTETRRSVWACEVP